MLSVMKTILFVCSHNGGRSQIAEAIVNRFYNDNYEAKSGGANPTSINPHVMRAMKEIGIDISNRRAKDVREFLGQTFDYVVTMCGGDGDVCPFFPGGRNFINKQF